MCPKLTVLWITSLLFDLIINLLMGTSLLALAKSIYYRIYKPTRSLTQSDKFISNGLKANSKIIALRKHDVNRKRTSHFVSHQTKEEDFPFF